MLRRGGAGEGRTTFSMCRGASAAAARAFCSVVVVCAAKRGVTWRQGAFSVLFPGKMYSKGSGL